jgi:hypothetical protein
MCSEEKDRQRDVVDLRLKNKYFIKAKLAEQEEAQEEAVAKEKQVKEFYRSIERSHDLADNLDELANFL